MNLHEVIFDFNHISNIFFIDPTFAKALKLINAKKSLCSSVRTDCLSFSINFRRFFKSQFLSIEFNGHILKKGIDSAMIRISAWGYHKNYHADNNKNHVKDIQCIFVWCQTYCNKKKEPGKISNIQGLLQEFQVMGSTWALPNILWVPDVNFWRFYSINLSCLQKSMGSTTILQKNQRVPRNPWNPL